MKNIKPNKPNFIKLNHLENGHSPKNKICNYQGCLNRMEKPADSWWLKCDKCFSWNCFFYPTKLQETYINDKTRIVLAVGGTNTGKTDASIFKIINYVMSNAFSQIMIIGPSRDRTHEILDEKLQAFLPREWVQKTHHRNYMWYTSFIQLINGSKIRFLTSRETSGIKGMSINKAYIVEASAVKPEVLEEIYGRLRNKTAIIYKTDKNGNYIVDRKTGKKEVLEDTTQVIYDLNPESHPYIEELAYSVGTLYYTHTFKTLLDSIKNKFEANHQNKVLFQFNAPDNIHSTENYIELVKEWAPAKKMVSFYGWFYESDEYIYGKTYHKGILPNKYIPIKENIKYYISGFDPGHRRAAAYLLGCYDKSLKAYVIYKSLRMKGFDIFRAIEEIKSFEYLNTIKGIRLKRTGDPAIRDKSIQGQLLNVLHKENLFFNIPKSVNFDWTVKKVNSMVINGKLKYCPTLFDFFDEKKKYITKNMDTQTKKAKNAKGVDDLLDCERYMIHYISMYGEEEEKEIKIEKPIKIKETFLNRHLEGNFLKKIV